MGLLFCSFSPPSTGECPRSVPENTQELIEKTISTRFLPQLNYYPWAKRQASKKVRRTCGIDDGGAYKKVYESWDIRDYRVFYTEKELARRELSFAELYRLYSK